MANEDLIDQLMSLDGPALRSALSGALGSLSGKATKAESNYREAEDDGTGRDRECGGCVYFTKSAGTVDGTCDEVAGSIYHEYVCDYYSDDGRTDGRADRANSDSGDNGHDSPDQEGDNNERGYSNSRGGRSRDRSPLDP